MGEHKGTITIILAVLVVFSIFILLANNYIKPITETIGSKFKGLSDDVFSTIDGSMNGGGDTPSE